MLCLPFTQQLFMTMSTLFFKMTAPLPPLSAPLAGVPTASGRAGPRPCTEPLLRAAARGGGGTKMAAPPTEHAQCPLLEGSAVSGFPDSAPPTYHN